jgi:hypothetical protein
MTYQGLVYRPFPRFSLQLLLYKEESSRFPLHRAGRFGQQLIVLLQKPKWYLAWLVTEPTHPIELLRVSHYNITSNMS